MAKAAKLSKSKPKIKASKVTSLGAKGAAPIKRRGRPKKLQTLEEVNAAINAKNPTYVSPITGGRLPGKGPKIDPSKLVPDTVDDELKQRVSANEIKITKLKNILKLRKDNEPTEDIAEVSLILQDIGNALSRDFANRITQEKDSIATLRGTADRKKRTGAEAGIEAVKKIGGTIGKAFDTVTAPAKGILDKVIQFFAAIAGGFIADKAITWLANNNEAITKFFKFLQNHGQKILIGLGAIVGGVLVFKIYKKIKALVKFVNGVFKGLNRARRLARVFLKRTLPKMLKNAKALIKNGVSAIKNFAKNIPGAKGLFKLGKNIIKGGKNLIKGGKTLLKSGGKLLKSGGKSLLKNLGKAGGKSLLKKIPIVGLGLGAAFAVGRLMSKPPDWKGALGEMASGAASMIPGVGTGLSLAIDAGMMVRDNKLSKDEKNLKDAMGDYESVAEVVAGKEQQLNFTNKVDKTGALTDPSADATTTVLDPITISQQAQQKQADFLGGEADTVPIIGAEDESNFYILQTKEKLGIYV